MKHPLPASLLVLLFAAPLAHATEPVMEPLKVNTADVLRYLEACAWKWTYRPASPFRSLSVKLMHYTRKADSQFEGRELTGTSSTFQEPRKTEDILIINGSKNGNATFFILSGLGGTGPTETSIPMSGYTRAGTGDGGLPMQIGSEYILMAAYKDNVITSNKDTMKAYISVEVETE